MSKGTSTATIPALRGKWNPLIRLSFSYPCSSVALNVIGTRFGDLYSLTSLRLYTSFCPPPMLYRCELWTITKSKHSPYDSPNYSGPPKFQLSSIADFSKRNYSSTSVNLLFCTHFQPCCMMRSNVAGMPVSHLPPRNV